MTSADHDTIVEDLLASDQEFRRLHQEHQECEERLGALVAKSFPTQDDETEEKKIKLHKLALKDQMEEMVRASNGARVTA